MSFSDLWDVAKLVGQGLAGELTAEDLDRARTRKRDTEPAPPPSEETSGVQAMVTIDYCARCDNEKKVFAKGQIIPCPVCSRRDP